MANHDEFCHARPTIDPERCAECKQLAAVRADERRHMSALVDRYADRLTDIRAKVAALRDQAEAARAHYSSDSANERQRFAWLLWDSHLNAYEDVLDLIYGSDDA